MGTKGCRHCFTRVLPGGLLALLLLLPLVGPAGAASPVTKAQDSRWQVMQEQGISWLRTPGGEPFFSLGVNVLDSGYPERLFKGRRSYHWGTFYADQAAWARAAEERLAHWGFNTAGAWSLLPERLRLPAIPDLELGRTAQFHWFDPFAPATARRVRREAANLVAPYKGNPLRIGYFLDNEVGWWNGALFLWYIKQPATNHTKQRLVALLRDHYRNDWRRFTRDFRPPPGVASFAALLATQGRITQLRPGGRGIRIIRRFTALVAGHYYRLLHRALREADPEALIFSDRLPIYYDPDAVRAMVPYVDVIATNYDIDTPEGWAARYYFAGLRALTEGKPVLVSEWFFAARENRTGNLNNGQLMTVPTQAERAQGAMAAAQRLAREPQVVGLHWFQYYDHPQGGRPDGEDYNFGLVDIDDRPYEALTAAFSRVNPSLARIHGQGLPPAPAADRESYRIPEANIDLHDRSLRDWPLAAAFVPGLATQPGEVVFGDLYLAWNRAGLYLATIAMDYYDPLLLAHDGPFPRNEAFRIAWGIDGGAGPRRFSLAFVPQKASPGQGDPQLALELCCQDGTPCTPLPAALASAIGGGLPRLSAEVLIPWQTLGLAGPPPDRQLRLEVTATSFYRSRWMSWSGLAPERSLSRPDRWQVVRLGSPSDGSGSGHQEGAPEE